MHGKDRSWHHAVKRGSAGVGSSQGGPAQRGSRLSSRGRRGRSRSPHGELRARQSGDDTGARVERRLQKLARGIFLVPPRSPRGGRGGAQVARYGDTPGRGAPNVSGERVQSAPRRVPSPGNSGALARSQGRDSSQRKALRSTCGLCLNGWRSCAGLAKWNRRLPDERRARRANAETEPPRKRPRSDRERQRWRRRVRPPQSKGAGGLQPTTAARCEGRHGRSSHGTQSRCAR